jgi:enamine deaminase RidA (YjgF/YER057c/UK114 family)
MINRSVETYPAFNIFTTSLHNQLFISASVTQCGTNTEHTAGEIYDRIADLLSDSSSQIVHERCFGNIGFQAQLLEKRSLAFLKNNIETNTPVTYVEGESCCESIFSGVQIRALKSTPETRVRTVMDQGISKGRAWTIDGSTFFVLHNIDGGNPSDGGHADRKTQSETMFRQAERILHAEGASYQDVLRTWIYMSNILDWYGDFNAIRNRFYAEYGFLRDTDSKVQAEQIYLPASTGIEGKNPSNMPATMDVFAVHRSPGSTIQIRPIYGIQQRSPFRYGSAFSRAVVVEEPNSKLVLVSGTASINEQGKSTFVGDPEAQIRHTLTVVSALIANEGATLQDLCETTVFLKHRKDFSVFQKIVKEIGIPNIPSVNLVADVCRDELLFELDAVLILEKNKI